MVDPIEALAYKVAVKVKQCNPDITAHVEDIRYGAAYYINYYSVIIVTLILGFLTGELLWTGISLISFGILRKYSGGFHLRSLTGCAVVTIILLSVIPHIKISGSWNIQALNLASLLLIVLYVENNTNKYMGVMLVMTNVLFASSTVALTFFVQALTIIRLNRGGEHR
ncbi:accessory gene regulator B family protein [Paenibacillus alba]|uniref:Accessory gene regulator B family protein n=1 Tax=Paenibacillus alba TaxID=1197127 RepID=A0ABU6GD36_9BACL|nr:accessory gene regulator B family protein [Paenibacillus alba]MEC0231162.1 accessory gene regulator B family protein [Paenibacillus alba]